MSGNPYPTVALTVTLAAITANACGGVPVTPLVPIGIALGGSVAVLALVLVGERNWRVMTGGVTAVALIFASVPISGIILRERERWTRSAVEDLLAPSAESGCLRPASHLMLPVTCSQTTTGVEYAYYSPAIGWCTLRSSAPSTWDCIVSN